MVDFNYAEMREVATELITEFGQTGQFVKNTSDDDVFGGPKAGNGTSFDVKLVPVSFETKLINGSTIKTGDIMCLMDSSTLGTMMPGPGDNVVIGSTKYFLVNNDPNNYNGTISVMHFVHLRLTR